MGAGVEEGEDGGLDFGPALLEGSHEDGLDEEKDVFGGGVVGSDEGAAFGVEGALEEGAEDFGGDVGPVEVAGDFVEDAEVSGVELDDGAGVEEASVEVLDGVLAEDAVGLAHGFEESFELAEELAGEEAVVAADEVAEEMPGEKAYGVCEEAEEETHEEVRDLLPGVDGCVGVAALFDFEALGEAGEDLGGFLGDEGVGAVGAEGVGVAEECAEDFERWKRAGGGGLVAVEIGEIEGVDALAGGGEVGVDFEAVEVADDEERRVAEVLAIVVDLLVGGLEVLVLALVLPGEVVAEPDVGEAFATVDLVQGLVEGVTLTGGVGCSGMRLAEHVAEIDEVGLRAAAFAEGVDLPTLDELCDGERH